MLAAEDLRTASDQRDIDALVAHASSVPALLVVCAPPGYGKVDLLDRAVEMAGSGGLGTVTRIDPVQGRMDPGAAARAVLEASGEDLVVIDDHRWSDGAALSEALNVRFSSRERPRVWIAVRHVKELALARLLAAGTAEVVDWRSLRLGKADIRRRAERIPPRFRKVVASLGHTWPAAHSLLRRWAQRATPDQAEWDELAIVAASGLDSFIEQEVIPLLEPEELEALVQLSISGMIDLESREAGPRGAAATRAALRAVAKLEGLLERSGDRVVIHPALRLWLSARFEASPCEQQTRTLLQTARSFEQRGDLVGAARLYRRAGQEDGIERLAVDAGSLLIWITRGFSVIREILEHAGPALVAKSPVLALMQCIVLMKTGRIAEAKSLFESVSVTRRTKTADLLRDREIVSVSLAIYGCDVLPETDFERFRLVMAQTGDNPGLKSLMSTFACALYLQDARFDASLASLVDARVHARNADSRYNLMFLSLHEASICIAQGALQQARRALADARKRWRREFVDDEGAETVMAALAASVEYELGQVSAARNSVRRSAYRMPNSEAWFDIYAAAYEPMARILVADHGLGTALEALSDQRRKLIAQGLPRVSALLQNLSVVLAGETWVNAGGDGMDCLDVAPLPEKPTWQEREFHALACAYAAEHADDPDGATRTLRNALRESERDGLRRSSLRYRMALATLLLRRGDQRASSELGQALRLGARIGARQVFVHSLGNRLTDTVSVAVGADDGAPADLLRFVETLCASRQHSDQSGKLVLSTRETEVLKALSEGGSDKVIGRLLNMSEHGVRFHLKSIYRKLNVHDRVSALHQARGLGVI